MSAGAGESVAVRALRGLARCVFTYPRVFFYPQVILFVLAIFYTITHLEFSTSRNDLVGSDKKYHQNFLKFKNEFGGQDDMVAVVESEDREKNRQFVERLGARMEADSTHFKDVFYKGDLKMMGHKALLFVGEDDLEELLKMLAVYRPFIQKFAQATNLNELFRQVNQQFRTASREPNSQTESMIKALPALRRIIQQAHATLSRPGTPPAPGMDALFNAGPEAEEQKYITFAHGSIYLVTARAPTEDQNGAALERLRSLVRETQVEVPGVNVGITGEPVLEYDEMQQSQHDSMVASISSLILVALIFVYGYRETGRPIKATLCLIVGLAYTLGYTSLSVGHLNILTVTFLPILIGLAIDFGVHLIARYEEELRKGGTERDALEKSMVFTGLGVFTGCFTTAGAFFAMALTDFKGIQEMGIITGGGILICLVPMMTLLPILLLRGRQNVLDHAGPAQPETRAAIERFWLQRPGVVILCTLGLCAACLVQARKVYFDYNLLHMQSKGLPAVVFEDKLIQSASNSVLFAAVVADSLAQAAELEPRLARLPTVASVQSISRFLAVDPTRKLEIIAEIKKEIAAIDFPEPDRDPVRTAELSQTLFFTQGYLGLASKEVEREGNAELLAELKELRRAIVDFRQALSLRERPGYATKLAAFQQALFVDIAETFEALKTQDDSAGLKIEDLPEALRNRFVGRNGKFLLQVFPKENVWERSKQEQFVAELRKIDGNVTGTPVQLLEYTTLLKESYQRAAWYALGAVAILVLVHFQSVACLVLALLPVLVGSVWMAGYMGLCGVPFNPANIMTLPLVVGIGVTNGIHILNRFAEEQNPGILAKSTGKAVLISALTTIAGFGSLIPAKHQGIASLGEVMAVGVATSMLASLTFLPAVLTYLTRWGWTIKKPSGNNALSTLGREEPR